MHPNNLSKWYQAVAENYERKLLQLQYQSLHTFLSSLLLLSFPLAKDDRRYQQWNCGNKHLFLFFLFSTRISRIKVRLLPFSYLRYSLILQITDWSLKLPKTVTSMNPAKQVHIRGINLDCPHKSARSFSLSITNMMTTYCQETLVRESKETPYKSTG